MQTAVQCYDQTQKMAQLHPLWLYDCDCDTASPERYEILKKTCFKNGFFFSTIKGNYLFAEFFLEIDDHLGEYILEYLMTVLFHRAIRKMRPSDEISPVFEDLNVTHSLHDVPF
jgi:hypothetical protein